MKPEGVSVGRDQLAGEITLCLNRIHSAGTVGWPALAESWRRTLDALMFQWRQRQVEKAFKGLGEA